MASSFPLKKSLRNLDLVKWFPSIIGFLVAFFVSVSNGVNSDSFPDGIIYQKQSFDIEKGVALPSEEYVDGLPQGIPLLLWILREITSTTSLLPFKLVACLFFAGSVLLAQYLTKKITESTPLSLLCGLMVSVDPFLLSFVSGIQSEIFTAFFCLAIIGAILKVSENWTRRESLILASLFFMIIPMRPNYLVSLLGVLFFLYIRFNWKNSVIREIVFILAIVSITLFTTYFFIAKKTQEALVISANAGANLWLACDTRFLPQVLGLSSKAESDRANVSAFKELISLRREYLQSKSDVSPSELDWYLRSKALNKCLENPLQSLGITTAKFLAFPRPFVNWGSYSPGVFLVSLSLWSFMLISLIFIGSKRDKIPLLRLFFQSVILLAFCLNLSLVPSAFQLRHRTAAFEAIGWVCIFIFVHLINARFEKKLK